MAVILLLFSLLFGAAYAEPYVVVGVGQAKLEQLDVDGHWHQQRFAHQIDQNSSTWRLGGGYQINSWLAVEGDYRDLGEFNSLIRYVEDHEYQNGCTDCDMQAAWLSGDSRGVALSAVVAPDWKVAPMLRAGVMWHWSQFTAHKVYKDGIVSFSREGSASTAPPFNDSGHNWLLGLGVRAGKFDAEVTWFPNIASGGSAYHDIYAFTLSARF